MIRIAKFLSQAGVASRRQAEKLIEDGRVFIDDVVVTDPATHVDPETSGVRVDHQPVKQEQRRIVVMLHKPAGVVSTAKDTHNRPTVIDFVRDFSQRLYPVGRLDFDTTGLLLLTNDGKLTYQLTHPKFHVPKTYQARVTHLPVQQKALRRLEEGVELEDGLTSPASVKLLAKDTLLLTIHEGRKRQIKRMCETVGHPVATLHRLQFGPIQLGTLAEGQVRELTDQEITKLKRAAMGTS